MKLYGKIIKGRKKLLESVAERSDDESTFRDRLEACLLELCGSLDIPVPLWLEKNTREFVVYRKTFFSNEQFIEKVWFDKFEIRLEQ